MANLDATQLRKRSNAVIFANKIFGLGNNNLFATDNGPFRASGVNIGNYKFGEWEYRAGQLTSSNAKMAKDLEQFLMSTSGNIPIELLGTYPPSKRLQSVPIKKCIKSEEFGGLTGKKENKGIAFERDFHESLLWACGARKGKGKYPNSCEALIQAIKKKTGKSAIDATIRGGENQPRPLSAGPIVGPSSHKAHGELLTDIDLMVQGGGAVPLSLKFGSTLTFMNAGVGRIFTKQELDEGIITNNIARDVMDMLGLDEKLFGATFSGFASGTFKPTSVDVTNMVNRTKFKKFLTTAIGSNYWMVHGKENGNVSFWFMNPSDINKYADLGSQKMMLYYGGKASPAKRVDLELSNSYFDLKINIRNKQSGIYPTHIMCDYKSKDVTGWKTTIQG
tara:strand:- start:74 stop:1249 length:1176 start_codon:yes stop_codon:yes gene_type:complete